MVSGDRRPAPTCRLRMSRRADRRIRGTVFRRRGNPGNGTQGQSPGAIHAGLPHGDSHRSNGSGAVWPRPIGMGTVTGWLGKGRDGLASRLSRRTSRSFAATENPSSDYSPKSSDPWLRAPKTPHRGRHQWTVPDHRVMASARRLQARPSVHASSPVEMTSRKSSPNGQERDSLSASEPRIGMDAERDPSTNEGQSSDGTAAPQRPWANDRFDPAQDRSLSEQSL